MKKLLKILALFTLIVGAGAYIQEHLQRPLAGHDRGVYETHFKRPLDAMVSFLSLVVLAPVLAVTAILVRVKLGTPVLFRQDRPGKREPETGTERIFRLCKFRTMTDERDADGELLPDSERLTPFGAWLRQTSIDELPELFNILKGDMSLVGPRPLLVQYLPYYTERERHRHDVRPGLTGLAQVNGRNYVGWDERLAYDAEYVEHITFAGDMQILKQTVKKVLLREDVAADTAAADEGYLDQIRGAGETT